MKTLFSLVTSLAVSCSCLAYACDNPFLHIDSLPSEHEIATESAGEGVQAGVEPVGSEGGKRPKPILPKGKCPHCNTDTTAWGDCWNPDCEYYGKRVI